MSGRNLLAESTGRNLLPKKTEVNPVAGTVRAGLQGATFGWSDEVGAALAAVAGSLQTGESFGNAYDKIHQQLQDKREQFSKDNPGTALAAELAGGLSTGIVGGAKALGGKAMQAASNAGKVGRIAGVGAAQGGIYGAGSADQGDTAEGALSGTAMGAVLAPVGAGVLNTAGRVAGGGANYIASKLGETAKGKAERVLRETAEASGETGLSIANKLDDLNRRTGSDYQSLGGLSDLAGDAILADVNDSFRAVARAGMNRIGTMRDAGRAAVDARQKNQQDRLMATLKGVAGDSDTYGETLSNLIKTRAEAAAPIYKEAFEQGVEMTPRLESLVNNSVLRPMYDKARRLAGDDSQSAFGELQVLHIMKSEVLDDAISSSIRAGERAKARRLTRLKSELLGEIEKQNPSYLKANETFSDHSKIQNALLAGRNLQKTDIEDLQSIVDDLSGTELEMFQLGAVKGISKMLEKVGENRDAARRLLQSSEMREKLYLVLGDETDTFLKRAGIEEQFTQTRNALTGNSTTELQQQVGRALDDSVDPGMVSAIANANPASMVSSVIEGMVKGRATPEVIDELGKIVFDNKLSRAEILRIFNQPRIRQALGDRYQEVVAPLVRASVVPAAQGAKPPA